MQKSSKDMESPILLYGDSYLSSNIIRKAKKKYNDADWITLPVKEDSDTDAIRAEIGCVDLNNTQKVLVINNLANQKNIREFLLIIAQNSSETKIVIWDSDNVIKVDPSSNLANTAIWKKFIKEFEGFGKAVNSGADFTIKQTSACVSYVKEGFKNRGHVIEHDAAELFVKLVGFDRGLLNSEMDKLVLTASSQIDYPFIIQNTFPSSQEAVLYVFSNALDQDSVVDCICMAEEFVHSGINENVIAEILMNKVRWHLVVADLFNRGMSWGDIPNKLMSMGKFPSGSSGSSGEKPKTLFEGIDYLCTERGMRKAYFLDTLKKHDEKAKMKKGATLPMPFIAHSTVKFVKTQIFNNMTGTKDKDKDKELLDRCLKVYLRLHNNLLNIRMGNFVKDNMYSMIKDLKDPNLR